MKLEYLAPTDLKPFEKNPRINDHAVDAVASSIQEFGFNCPIVVGPDNRICAGHTRWKAAQQLGMAQVPVLRVDSLTAEKFIAFNIADNQTASLAIWEEKTLAELLTELNDSGAELANLGFSDLELRRLLRQDDEVEEVAEINPADIEAHTKSGDIIALGDHRLLCGDSRCSTSIQKLLRGEGIDHVFGGPPYFNQRVYARWSTNEEYLSDMQAIICNAFSVAKEGTVIAWNIASGSRLDHISHNSTLLERAGFEYLDTIAWVKAGANFDIRRSCHITTTGHYFPALQWEAILIYQKPGTMPKMDRQGQAYMKNYQTNVWEITQVIHQKEQYGHPAVCPVEIPYRCMQAYSRKGGLIFEPFGGSGTTLIAAEKAGRKSFLVEQHPAYCDVIIRRWEELTGNKAELIENIGS